MKTVEIKLYQYDELSPKAKEKALAWAEEVLVDDWEECVIDDWMNKLEKMGINHKSNQNKGGNIPIEFDLYRGHCKILNVWIDSEFIAPLAADLPLVKTIVDLKNSDFSLGKDGLVFINKEEYEIVDDDKLVIAGSISNHTPDEEWDILTDRINDAVKALEKEILKDLREAYDYATGEEALRDAMMANEYDFTEEGKRW